MPTTDAPSAAGSEAGIRDSVGAGVAAGAGVGAVARAGVAAAGAGTATRAGTATGGAEATGALDATTGETGAASATGAGPRPTGTACPPLARRSGTGGVGPVGSAVEATDEPDSTRMIGRPTSTVSPSATSRPVTVPANGDGSSTSDFAVSISTRTWSTATSSPIATRHWTISASLRPSPTSGRGNSATATSAPSAVGRAVERWSGRTGSVGERAVHGLEDAVGVRAGSGARASTAGTGCRTRTPAAPAPPACRRRCSATVAAISAADADELAALPVRRPGGRSCAPRRAAAPNRSARSSGGRRPRS